MTATVVVAAAAVVTAGVTFSVMVVMVAALDIGIIAKISGQEVCNRCIRITANTAVKLDTGLLESHPGTAADAAADQHIRIQAGQKTCQSTVAAAAGVHHFGCNHNIVFHFVYLELLGVTEVLEDQTVSVSNCDSHDTFAPLSEIPLL